ncbi:CBS domain-containing protein [Candidatus Pacearchaeota archaeon]|nr:CBS domain-containing protein [Candidatus Pacearchaeota archaeon]
MNKEKLRDAVICKENDSVLEVSRILRDTGVRHLIVVDNKNSPVGIISTVDICNRVVSRELNPKKTKAKEIMTKPIQTSDVEESYESAYRKMVAQGTYSIPIVENNELIGELDFNQLFCKFKEEE